MVVIGMPAFVAKHLDPGNYNLYRAISSQGVVVKEWSFIRMIKGQYDILHIHWPDLMLQSRWWIRACLKSIGLIVCLAYVKLIGKKIIWTAHNLQSHDQYHPALEKLFWKLFLYCPSGIIFHSKGIRAQALESFSRFGKIKDTIIPLAHFRGTYQSNISKKEARQVLNLEMNKTVLLFMGRIKPYKNVSGLIKLFSEIPSPDYTLLVAGRVTDQELKDELAQLSKNDSRVRLDAKFIENNKLALYFSAADCFIASFSSVTNSGSTLLSLSLDTPVIVSDHPVFRDLEEEFGHEWVSVFKNKDDLLRLINSDFPGMNRDNCPIDLTSREIDDIARKTINFYNEIF